MSDCIKNYLCPVDLGITEEMHRALFRVREELANGTITHIDVDNNDSKQFDMNSFGYETGCGTAACIGGWMAIFLTTFNEDDKYPQDKISDFIKGDGNGKCYISNLFYPHGIADWRGITPDIAVEAIDNYLTSGDPNWIEIVMRNLK